MFNHKNLPSIETVGLIVYLPIDGSLQSWHTISMNTELEDELESILLGCSDDLEGFRVLNTVLYREDSQIKAIQPASTYSDLKPNWIIVVLISS